MNIIIAVILVVVCAVSRSTFQDRRPPIAATTIEPSAPMDAASDGAAMPAMIEPRTAPTSAIGGATTLKDLRQSSAAETAALSSLEKAGTLSGRTIPRTRMYMM